MERYFNISINYNALLNELIVTSSSMLKYLNYAYPFKGTSWLFPRSRERARVLSPSQEIIGDGSSDKTTKVLNLLE